MEGQYTCIIVDDEQLARELLKEFVSKTPLLKLLGLYKNPIEAMSILKSGQVDILFLDIQMPEINGVDFLKTIGNKPCTIFTTAYSEFALEGYELEVTDYLVKPFSFERFLQAVNKATRQVDLERRDTGSAESPSVSKDYILLHADHKIYKVALDDIQYIEGLKEYVSYYTEDKRIIVLQSLRSIEENLPSEDFIRVHRSYIVPIRKISALEGNQISVGGKLIPIGRSYRESVIQRVFDT